MTPADPRDEKAVLRRIMRSRLASVTAAQARSAGIAIARHLVPTGHWRHSRCVALFSSRSDEVDTAPLIEAALRDGKQVLLPRMVEGEALEFAELGDPARLRIGHFGIAEPPPGLPAIRPDADTVLLLPGLAFDRQGGRLGRGGGYYDRALAGFIAGPRRPLLVGAGFSFQLVEHVPMTALDVRLDGVVSELEIVETEAWGRMTARGEDKGRGMGRP